MFTFFSNIVDFLNIAAFRLQFESQLEPEIINGNICKTFK